MSVVGDRAHAAAVGADEIVGDEVARRRGAGDRHAALRVAGDDVAGRRLQATDRIAGRPSICTPCPPLGLEVVASASTPM